MATLEKLLQALKVFQKTHVISIIFHLHQSVFQYKSYKVPNVKQSVSPGIYTYFSNFLSGQLIPNQKYLAVIGILLHLRRSSLQEYLMAEI